MPPIETWRKIITNRKSKLNGGILKFMPSGDGIYVGFIESIEINNRKSKLIITTIRTAHSTGRGAYSRHERTQFEFDILNGPDPSAERDCISWDRGDHQDPFILELWNYGVKARGGFDAAAALAAVL